MPDQLQPSYGDLHELARLQAERVRELEQRLAELAEQNQRLAAENEELRRRLGSNSSNSSRPPSSDSPYGKPKPKQSGLRGRSGRKPGKQPGEPGTTRRQVDSPDERIPVEPACCSGRGGGLSDAAMLGVQKRQVLRRWGIVGDRWPDSVGG